MVGGDERGPAASQDHGHDCAELSGAESCSGRRLIVAGMDVNDDLERVTFNEPRGMDPIELNAARYEECMDIDNIGMHKGVPERACWAEAGADRDWVGGCRQEC